MDRKTISKVKKLFKKLEKNIKIEKAFVFGSRVKGNFLEYSDLDLIVISKDFEGKDFFERTKYFYKNWDWEIPLEVFCYTPSEFEKKKRQVCLVKEALKEAKKIL